MRKFMTAFAVAAGLMAMTPQLASAEDTAAAATGQATPAKIALVRRMFAAMHFDKMMSDLMLQMVPAMLDAELKSHPELKPDEAKAIKEAVTEATQEYMQEDMPAVFDKMFVVYAEELTEDELIQTNAFYESPVGQSMIAKLPRIMAKAMPIVTADIPAMQAKMKARIEAKICARLDCKTAPAAGGTKGGKSKG